MTYVTHGYMTKQFDTYAQALESIKSEMDEQKLSYQCVFDRRPFQWFSVFHEIERFFLEL